MQEPRDTGQSSGALVVACAVVVGPLVGLNVFIILVQRTGERWSERDGEGCEGTSANPIMLKDLTNKHLIYQVTPSYSEKYHYHPRDTSRGHLLVT